MTTSKKTTTKKASNKTSKTSGKVAVATKKASASINYKHQHNRGSGNTNYIGWHTSRLGGKQWATDASVAGLPALTGYVHREIVKHAQQLDASNSFATSLLDRAVEHIVQSSGFLPTIKSEDAEWVYIAEQKFNEWLTTADVSGLDFVTHLSLVTRSFLRDGDVAVVFSKDGENGGLQIIESNRIITPADVGDRNIIDGIEVNEVGKMVAIHVNVGSQFGVETKRIRAEFCAFISRKKRAIAVRGESCFAQYFQLFEDLEEFRNATVQSARAQANVVYSIETTQAGGSGLYKNAQQDSNGDRLVQNESGSVFIAPPNTTMKMLKADSVSLNNGGFIRDMQRALGASVGVPIELFDVSETNWSSSKSAQAQARLSFAQIQASLINCYLVRMMQWWLDRAVVNGVIPAPKTSYTCGWIKPAYSFNDETSQLQGDLLALNMGTKTMRQLLNEKGLSYEAQLLEIKQEMQDREAYGLPEVVRSTFIQQATNTGSQNIEELAKAVADYNKETK